MLFLARKPSCLNQGTNMHMYSTIYKHKTVQNSYKQICQWISNYLFCEVLWIIINSFLLYKTLTYRLESCGLHLDYCLGSHSDGTLSLQRIHWWANYVMLNLSKFVLINKQTRLPLGWPEGEHIFSKFKFFGWTFLLKCDLPTHADIL